MVNKKGYTTGEEIAHSITHGIGAVFGVVALTILVIFGSFFGNKLYVVSFSIYGVSLIIMYTMSTLYHALTSERVKNVFQILDHSAIYLLIAGSYTPFCLVALNGAMGWTLFGIVWGIAVAGIVLEAVVKKRSKLFSSIIYIMMGWIIIWFLKPIGAAVNSYCVFWLVLGGMFYTLGVIFYVYKKLRYHHAVWHMFVLLGSICHFVSMFYLLPAFNG